MNEKTFKRTEEMNDALCVMCHNSDEFDFMCCDACPFSRPIDVCGMRCYIAQTSHYTTHIEVLCTNDYYFCFVHDAFVCAFNVVNEELCVKIGKCKYTDVKDFLTDCNLDVSEEEWNTHPVLRWNGKDWA